MNLVAGDRRPGIITGVTDDGLPVVVPFEGKCTHLVAGERRVGIITGVDDDGLPIVAWSNQKCKAGTSSFEAGKRYIGLITGVDDDGTPIIGSWCERCDDEEIFILCDCPIPATITATVKVAKSGDPFTWSDPVDVDLVNGSFDVDCVQTCCDAEDCSGDVVNNTYQQTFSSSSGTYTGYDGDYPYRTEVWRSDAFTLEGRTLKAFLVVTEFTFPDEVTVLCSYFSGIIELGDYGWTIVYGYQSPGPSIAPPFGSPAGVVLVTSDNKAPCEAPFSYEQSAECGDLVTDGGCGGGGGYIHCGPSTVVPPGCSGDVFDWHWRDTRSLISCAPGTEATQQKCIDLHIYDS